MKLLYFAWLRQKIGTGEETVTLPRDVSTVADLLDWLETRGPEFQHALEDRDAIKVAINQTFAQEDAPLSDQDEVALFPPVTGG